MSVRPLRELDECGPDGAVLQLSMRRLSNLVANAMVYEFEDVVRALTGADRIEPDDAGRINNARRAYKWLRRCGCTPALARAALPPPAISLRRDYALFLASFNDAHELYALASVPDWRRRCERAVCFIAEIWPRDIPGYLIELLSAFDHIFLGVQAPLAEVARLTGRPCSYLPLAADVPRFSPCPRPASRVIDVCNLGRRGAVTHRALLDLAAERRIVYYYDTVVASGLDRRQRTFRIGDAGEHRLLLATLLRHSRFYLANRARINEPALTGDHQEISGRYYEGVAAGAVMLGEAPVNAAFARQFDWPDATIALPFDTPDVGAVLEQLACDPQRLERISRTNARQAALRHDWLHRLAVIFAALDLPWTAAMHERDRRLRQIAVQASEPGIAAVPPSRYQESVS